MLRKAVSQFDPSAIIEQRQARRRKLRFGLQAGAAGDGERVLLLELSETGLRFQTDADLGIGDTLDLCFPEAGEVAARIIRRANVNEFGAEFGAPISSAVVSATLLAAPIEVAARRKRISLPAMECQQGSWWWRCWTP